MSAGETSGGFARRELERSGGRAAALARIGALNHAARMLDFLGYTLREYEEASAAFRESIDRHDALLDAHGAPRPETRARASELFEEGGRLSVVVHLRIETFYALARLLLDRVAQALEAYFGPVPGLPLRTHRELERNVAAFAAQHGLEAVPPGLVESARVLSVEIVAERDLHVRLPPGPRAMTASVWAASGHAGVSPTDGCPGPGAEGSDLHALMEALQAHVEGVVAYLDANRRA